MITLEALQKTLSHAIRNHKHSENYPNKILDLLSDTKQNSFGLSPREGLTVYTRAYHARITEALASNFEAVNSVLGHHVFFHMTQDYLKAFPSHYTNLEEVGAHLPTFLAESSFLKDFSLLPLLAFLPDLARLEFQCVQCFYTPSLPQLHSHALLDLAEHEWESVSLQLDPPVQLLKLNWSVFSFWQQLGQEMEQQTELESGPERPDHNNEYLIIYKTNDSPIESRVQVKKLNLLEWTALTLLQQNLRLDQFCEKLMSNLSDQSSPPPLQKWFQDWVASGIIRKIA